MFDAVRSEVPAGSSAVPTAFVFYTLWIVVSAAAGLAVLALMPAWHVESYVQFSTMAVFVVLGELFPIPVPRRAGLDKVTISSPFAFAMLLQFGAGPATLVYAASSIIADCVARTAPVKIVFNAAQYVLAMLAAAAVLVVGGQTAAVQLTGAELPLIGVSAAVFFAANHVLAGVGAAILGRLPVVPYLRDDFVFQAWTAGCLLAFAPAVVASLNVSAALVPVTFVPMLAIYAGGRQAALNRHRAFHDPLTDLPNRTMLLERLQAACGGERQRPMLAVMILDLDDFKTINDTLGHEFGDLVLQQVADRLKAEVGPRGTLARLGGDEFAAVLEDVEDEEHVVAGALRLLAALERPLEVESLALQITGSIGIACSPQHGGTVRDLMRHADIALYCAKNGDDSYALYADEQDEYSLDRLALAAQLRRGIDRGELVVHYQLKAPLRGDGRCGVEALVRWNHPQLGRIGPEGFISLAEQTGVIKQLTDRVLEAALGQCAAWRRDGLDVRVSVNISTRSLLDHHLPTTIRVLLQRFELPSRLLQLEITESRIVADLGRARRMLEELRAMGVTIAIDDFGTGFSSLSQLQQLPVDEIKIDRSFVKNMETDAGDAVLVRSIVELGRNLGLRVTAEGVESQSVMRSLTNLGCDFAQGFHIGRPVAADECRRHLESSHRPGSPVLTALPGLREQSA
jgi:diguanylate cyclase (GGDEF)-like protein